MASIDGTNQLIAVIELFHLVEGIFELGSYSFKRQSKGGTNGQADGKTDRQACTNCLSTSKTLSNDI